MAKIATAVLLIVAVVLSYVATRPETDIESRIEEVKENMTTPPQKVPQSLQQEPALKYLPAK